MKVALCVVAFGLTVWAYGTYGRTDPPPTTGAWFILAVAATLALIARAWPEGAP